MADFLNQMQSVTTGNVICATRYDVDGAKGAALWVINPTSGNNPNVLGHEPIKMRMPYDLFDKLKAMQDSKEIQLPGILEIQFTIEMGSANKPVLTANSIRKHIPDSGIKKHTI